VHPNHHAHSESSHPPTSYGHNPPHQHDERSLETLIPHPYQVYTPSNSLDSAYRKHTAYYYVTPPVRSNFIQRHLHLTYLFIGKYNTHYIEKRAVRNGRLLRKLWYSSDLELASMYATFRESMKIFNRGPTNHKTSRVKHQQITARHSSSHR
jgi:hypothetical protein